MQYNSDDNPSKTNKMMRILMFVRILSLIRLARVSRLVRFFNEVEKVGSNSGRLSSGSGDQVWWLRFHLEVGPPEQSRHMHCDK